MQPRINLSKTPIGLARKLLCARYGWLYGSFIASALLSLLLMENGVFDNISQKKVNVRYSIYVDDPAGGGGGGGDGAHFIDCSLNSSTYQGSDLCSSNSSNYVNYKVILENSGFLPINSLIVTNNIDLFEINASKSANINEFGYVEVNLLQNANNLPNLKPSDNQWFYPIRKNGVSGGKVSDMIGYFKPNSVSIASDLNCPGSDVKNLKQQAWYYYEHLPVTFSWSFVYTASGKQVCTIVVYLEGTLIDSGEIKKIPIVSDNWTVDVNSSLVDHNNRIPLGSFLMTFLFTVINIITTILPYLYRYIMNVVKNNKRIKRKTTRRRSASTNVSQSRSKSS